MIEGLRQFSSVDLKMLEVGDEAPVSAFAATFNASMKKDVYQKNRLMSLHEYRPKHLMSNNRKDCVIRKISDRLEFIAQRADDWNERGSKAPNKDALASASKVLAELYDLVEVKQLLWLNPFISSDEDGLITVVWHGNNHTLHLNIDVNEIEYIKVWRESPKTYLDAGVFNNDNRLNLWEWLIMNENQLIDDNEILYRNVRSDPKYDEYIYEQGELKILANAFLSRRGRKPSVDRAKVVENNPHKTRMKNSGVVSFVAGEVRQIDSVVTTVENESVYHDVDVVFTPSSCRPAHSEIVTRPDFFCNRERMAYRRLRVALADIATKRGWIIPPSEIE